MIKVNESRPVANTLINSVFLIVLNLILILIIGYLTLDSAANLNSRIGAVLLSFLIPYYIVSKTYNMSGIERMLKFGFGFIGYIILAVVRGFMVGNLSIFLFHSLLIPCLLAALAFLYYGNSLFKVGSE